MNEQSNQTLLDYYGDIIPDVDDFLRVIQEPLPTCFWANTLKINPDQLKTLLVDEGIHVSPVLWNPQAFRSDAAIRLGKQWPYLIGLLQIQEEVSMLPGVILDPKPGEKILDLCAAPGSKSSQMAVMMNNYGTLIANDHNYNRLRALGQIIKRLGIMNIGVTVYDGKSYPRVFDTFDKVLVDAPCTCEGTMRKGVNKIVMPDQVNSRYMSQIQQDLLRKAIKLCKPGGRIVYSTCTFAPEENEQVVNNILLEMEGKLRLLPISIPHFKGCEGLTKWRDQHFDQQLKHTMRVWPHLNNTGGFFVALIEKIGKEEIREIKQKVIQPKTPSVVPYLEQLQKRFGFEAQFFNKFQFSHQTRKGIYITHSDIDPPESLKMDVVGLFFMKTKIKFPKLTTAASMLFGRYATSNVIELTVTEFQTYLQGQDLLLTEQQVKLCTGMGYVLIQCKNYYAGQGLLFIDRDTQQYHLRSLFPRSLRLSGFVN